MVLFKVELQLCCLFLKVLCGGTGSPDHRVLFLYMFMTHRLLDVGNLRIVWPLSWFLVWFSQLQIMKFVCIHEKYEIYLENMEFLNHSQLMIFSFIF